MNSQTKTRAPLELNGHAKAQHGGAREGAGRKPKALLYSDEIAAAETQILAALPDVLESLIHRAQCGDVAAGKYLIDRVLGRIAEQTAPLVNDTALPFTEEDLEAKENSHVMFRKLAAF